MYSCWSATESLTWNFYDVNGKNEPSPVIFTSVGDRLLLSEKRGQTVATLLSNTPMNLSSQLVVPYTPSWNGMKIQCMSQMNDSQTLSYVIAGKFNG